MLSPFQPCCPSRPGPHLRARRQCGAGVPAIAGSSCIAGLASLSGPTACPPTSVSSGQTPASRRTEELCTEWALNERRRAPVWNPETAALTLAFLFV